MPIGDDGSLSPCFFRSRIGNGILLCKLCVPIFGETVGILLPLQSESRIGCQSRNVCGLETTKKTTIEK
ncbi:hypothetical protein HMPREF3226_02857 [Prevotella corporis]|uniref:Uncharacterized protein n=1 Tax=Prevotella corporis TaxID=28128 RepID=A0A133PT19_9BACT|nr:hypothetical protein HMPREF3226_02857 [Prevotella corporis]